MAQNPKSFEEYLAFGKDGEHEVAAALIRRGVTIMPLYQFDTDHAPFIMTVNQRLVCPDLLCFGKTAFMVEVKTKNQWVRYCGIETGIDLRLFEQYQAVQTSTRLTVWLFFNHKIEEPTGIFFVELSNFTRTWDGCFKGERKYQPMVFYRRAVLHDFTATAADGIVSAKPNLPAPTILQHYTPRIFAPPTVHSTKQPKLQLSL